MKTNIKKMAVLLALKKHSSPVGLPELLSELGSDFAERSVRRWLSEWVVEKRVIKTGINRGTLYQSIEPNAKNSRSTESRFIFSGLAKRSLQRVKKTLFQRNPVGYSDEWVNAYQPNHTFYFTKKQHDTFKTLQKPDFLVTPFGTYVRKIYDRLLIDLSYNSSRLEGNTYSLSQTEKLVMEGVESAGKLTAEKIMILNHKEAIRYLVDNGSRLEINFDALCTLHYLLSDALVSSQYAGRIRDHSVRISQSTYMPIDHIERLTKQLSRLCVIASKIHNPFEQSLFLLVHVAYLQAFTDVNKRTSRLAANIPLIKNNLYPLSFSCIDKDDYASAMLAIYEYQDVQPLAELYSFSLVHTAKEYNVLMNSVDVNDVSIQFRKELREILREIIVTKLSGSYMLHYIQSDVSKKIPLEFRQACEQWINDELKYMGPERIVGLGITKEELLAWRKLQ